MELSPARRRSEGWEQVGTGVRVWYLFSFVLAGACVLEWAEIVCEARCEVLEAWRAAHHVTYEEASGGPEKTRAEIGGGRDVWSE